MPEVIWLPAMAIVEVEMAVTKPLPLTVIWMNWLAAPKVPTLELTVAKVAATEPGPVAVTSPVRAVI